MILYTAFTMFVDFKNYVLDYIKRTLTRVVEVFRNSCSLHYWHFCIT